MNRADNLVPSLQKLFPHFDVDLIRTVAVTNNGSLEETVKCLTELTGTTVDKVSKVSAPVRQKSSSKRKPVPRRGWRNVPVKSPSPASDELDDEKFAEWLSAQKTWDESQKISEKPQEPEAPKEVSNETKEDIKEPVAEVVPEEPKPEQKIEEIKVEEIKVEEIKVEEMKVEEMKVEEIKVEEIKVEPKIEEAVIEVPKIEEPVVTEIIQTQETIEEKVVTGTRLVVKFYFGENDYIYRLGLYSPSYADLKNFVDEKIKNGLENLFTGKIKYKDDEGDLITITSHNEWLECLSVVNEDQSKPIKLYVS